jgi:hypothetical protein
MSRNDIITIESQPYVKAFISVFWERLLWEPQPHGTVFVWLNGILNRACRANVARGGSTLFVCFFSLTCGSTAHMPMIAVPGCVPSITTRLNTFLCIHKIRINFCTTVSSIFLDFPSPALVTARKSHNDKARQESGI